MQDQLQAMVYLGELGEQLQRASHFWGQQILKCF